MINKPATAARAATEIARLEKVNAETEARIRIYRANFANEQQVQNAVRGLRYREERIRDLKAAF